MNLLQSISKLIEKISITDKQEENIKASVKNITTTLEKDDTLHLKETFLNGSYERDTMIRPLDDIDIFVVLDESYWKDDFGVMRKPQSVLDKIKDFLNDQNDYKGKVRQDRPCVTVELSNKSFDILPAFEQIEGYLMPNYNLESWIPTYPKILTENLKNAHRDYSYKLKDIIRVIKYWNKLNGKMIPSFHIEEVAIKIFKFKIFENFEKSIREWFEKAECNLEINKFKSNTQYDDFKNKLNRTKTKLQNAKEFLDKNNQYEAKKIWKDVFGKEFPTVNEEEAKLFSKHLSEGTLKATSIGLLSTTLGKTMAASKGFYGEEIF
ncbi:SMODS domain-containing nucleotidyltransferase [Capnocytophaga sputigena]|jgi:hypothetical protein|uniref:Nucleotidyltransferase n=1 Tax=Capnocytophaga sputigena TaxID=1019 RepID=A0AAX2I7T5_CAPSP|nr:nucleotidyltransferase [Capnocytophaga sputigena]ATA83493.1 nucleotidyltransferase [Capnocytophaga sputigena]EEB65044.1 hypothetical protein CAPSP0001_0331 [Capnocytophaga sputigena ATCC 33612]SQA74461.1 tRNA CCA-pyrophosphorylase [Capnocytophaga sputigena]